MDYYILDVDGNVVAIKNLIEWAQWMSVDENRRVARTVLGKVTVSTSFLGLDHRYVGKGEPIVYETMVFGGRFEDDDGEWQRRYTTRAEAEKGHKEAVIYVEQAFKVVARGG